MDLTKRANAMLLFSIQNKVVQLLSYDDKTCKINAYDQ